MRDALTSLLTTCIHLSVWLRQTSGMVLCHVLVHSFIGVMDKATSTNRHHNCDCSYMAHTALAKLCVWWVIRLKRIYNFWCSMFIYTPFCFVFCYISWCFYVFSGTNLLTSIVLKMGPVSEPVRWLAHWFTGRTGGSTGSIATKNHQIW
jgi:hypothetical protein